MERRRDRDKLTKASVAEEGLSYVCVMQTYCNTILLKMLCNVAVFILGTKTWRSQLRIKCKENAPVVCLQGDGAYNNPLYSGAGRTPFQHATQVAIDLKKNFNYRVKVVTPVIDLDPVQNIIKSIPGISQLHNFKLEDSFLRVWKAYGIGAAFLPVHVQVH
ncbi:unnamed protein product [Mytilus edulis]|uniref:Uncharacterized protein n=1 Tax=Mytilus edulis TaxID=6550 RepID=A0A8S3S4Q7_MYTED|nr:unnamed protein product [Mytilus edulis]